MLMLLAALSPLLVGAMLLTASPAQGVGSAPPTPSPIIASTDAALAGADDARPIQAQLTIGRLADKPETIDLADYCPPDNAIEAASGEQVVFCYRMRNDSNILFTRHTIVDDIFQIILENAYFPVSPTLTVQFVVPITASVTRTNAMTWTAYADNGDSASAFDQATLFVPTVELTATVGATPGACADANRLDLSAAGEATFCFRVHNPTPYPLIGHHAVDAQGNALAVPDDLVLAPGAIYTLTTSVMVTAPLRQQVTWTARTATRQLPVTATASASVRTPSIDVTLDMARAGADCRPGELTIVTGTSVLFCYTAFNDGSLPLKRHRVIDPAIELDYTFTQTLMPDAAVGIVVTRPITVATTSNVTWYATLTDGRVVSATTQGHIAIAPPGEIVAKLWLANAASGVPGVEVELIAPDNIRQKRITNDAGEARFTDLAPGLYHVQIVTPSLNAQLSLLSPATISANLTARGVISVTYALTGALPLRALHLPLISR
ncbi:MAG TPA: hypothetical protein DCL15_23200 [Chloroflexi bacterium]|nr:hypothetical protein [Chloroflexota bacterium]